MYYKTKIDLEQKRHALWLVTGLSYGNRGRADGSFVQQAQGKLGEVVMADILGQPRPAKVKGQDRGIDFNIFGKTVDIKTEFRNRPCRPSDNYLSFASQSGYLADIILIASAVYRMENEKRVAEILEVPGWLTREEILKCARGVKFMARRGNMKDDGYYIPYCTLRPFQDPTAFVHAIDGLTL
jgi:hypothetical protein